MTIDTHKIQLCINYHARRARKLRSNKKASVFDKAQADWHDIWVKELKKVIQEEQSNVAV